MVCRCCPLPRGLSARWHRWLGCLQECVTVGCVLLLSTDGVRTGAVVAASETIHVKRDTQLSIAYSEELISSTISATLQSTDRHHGIVGQERCHFQLDS